MPRKRTLQLLAVLVVLILLASSLLAYSLFSPRPRGLSLPGFDADRAFADLQNLSDLGPRVPGTEGDLRAAEYVRGKFSESGLSGVSIEEYPVTTFAVNSASLSLIALQLRGQIIKNYRHITDFVLYQYSGSTGGNLRLEIVDIGNGSEEALSGADVSGKAVLSTAQCLPRAAERGARAVIVQNLRLAEQLDYPPFSGGLYGSDANGDSIPYPDAYPQQVVPTCAVSRAVGEEIRAAIEKAKQTPVLGMGSVWVQLNFDTTIGRNSIYNVIGDVRGGKNPEDMIYIVAHRDSTYINPGAVDNAGGTVTIMELARQLARCRTERTIRFISTDAEETGLLGATGYVKAHAEEVQKHGVICINFDMNDVNLERVRTLNIEMSDDNWSAKLFEIRSLMFGSHPDLEKKYIVNITKGGGGADGAPFMKRGTAGSLAMGEWGSSWEYHTQWDTIDHVNRESWAVGGMMLGSLALYIAGVQ